MLYKLNWANYAVSTRILDVCKFFQSCVIYEMSIFSCGNSIKGQESLFVTTHFLCEMVCDYSLIKGESVVVIIAI